MNSRHALSQVRRVCAAIALAAASGAQAGEMVYTFTNPTFGGSPLNGSSLLATAQAQNKTKDPDAVSLSGSTSKTSLEQFNEILERAVLSRLATAATSTVFGSNGQLIPGTVETGNFSIAITDMQGGMLLVTTTDKVSGASTSFQVGKQ